MEIKRCYDTIIGASVGENQLYGKTGNSTNKGITFTNTNGRIAISGVNDGTGTSYYIYNFTTSVPANHVVAFRSGVNGGSATTYDAQLIADGGSNEISYDGKSYIVTKKSYSWTGCNLNVRTGYNADQNPVTFAPEIIDLTQKLGTSIADYIYSLEQATAGSGIAKLRSWGFPRGYQAFNAGSIESVEVTGKKVVGFNQWDEEIAEGYYNGTTGAFVSSANHICSKNLNKCLPNTVYYQKAPANLYICYYDINGNYHPASSGQKPKNSTFTTPNDAYYFIWWTSKSAYGASTYQNDICINLSSDRNGEYEPYTEQEYDYGTDVLRGIFKLDANNNLFADGDRKEADGTITRKMKPKTLEQVDVTYSPNNSGYANIAYARITKPSDAKGINSALPLLILLEGYVTSSATSGWDTADKIGYLFYGADTAYWWVGFPHGTTIEQMKTALAGKELIYELATPTTEQSTPFTSPQICYPDGTEEYVTANGVPVGHETRYEL